MEDIEWRSGLARGDLVDCVKPDLGFGLFSWARGEIIGVMGAGDKNLGNETGDNVRKFTIKFLKDASSCSKTFRADSLDIAPFDSKTNGEEWRYNLKVGDEVDALDYASTWHTVTVIKTESESNGVTSPFLTVGFRRYKPEGP